MIDLEYIWQRCYYYALRFPSLDPAVSAEDLVQDALLKTLDRLDVTRPLPEQIAYVKFAVRQCAIDQHRRLVKRPQHDEIDAHLAAPGNLAATAMTSVYLAALVTQLLLDHHGGLLLAYAMGYTPAEQATASTNVNTIKTQMYRARQRLRATHDAAERVEELEA